MYVQLLKPVLFSGQESRCKFALTCFPETTPQVQAFEEHCSKLAAIILATDAGNVVNVKKDTVRIAFTRPVCANIGDKIAMSRRVDLNFRLIGWGEIKKCFTQKTAN